MEHKTTVVFSIYSFQILRHILENGISESYPYFKFIFQWNFHVVFHNCYYTNLHSCYWCIYNISLSSRDLLALQRYFVLQESSDVLCYFMAFLKIQLTSSKELGTYLILWVIPEPQHLIP